MTATRTALKPLGLSRGSHRLLLVGAPLTLAAAREHVGDTLALESAFGAPGEIAAYSVQSVSESRETGDITAWIVDADGRGQHARIVAA